MIRRPDTLRSYMERGANPFDVLNDLNDQDTLTYTALHADHRDDDPTWIECWSAWIDELIEEGNADQAREPAWKLELIQDPEIRAWFVSVLPPAAVARFEGNEDVTRRPFTLEVVRGAHRCPNCGEASDGMFVHLVDRISAFDPLTIGDEDLHFCVPCVAGILEEARRG